MNNLYNLTSINDIVNDKETKIHNELFNNAIRKYIQYELLNDDNIDIDEYIESHYIIIDAHNNETYLDFSDAILLTKFKPLKRIKVNLEKYWNKNYINIYKEINNENLIIDNNNLKESEFEYVNFIEGKVYYKNKFTNKIFGIPFNKFHKDVEFRQLKNINE